MVSEVSTVHKIDNFQRRFVKITFHLRHFKTLNLRILVCTLNNTLMVVNLIQLSYSTSTLSL